MAALFMEVLAEEEIKVSKMEEEIKSAEKKVKPGEEEAALGIEAAKVSDEEIEVIAKLFAEGLTTLKASMRTLDANAAQAPPSLKTLLHKLAERAEATVSKINELMTLTKDQRERVMSQAFLQEGKEKVDAIDQALEKVNDAELPFLEGLEVLALNETKSTLAASDEAAAALQSAVSSAGTFIASKNLEIKKFGEGGGYDYDDSYTEYDYMYAEASASTGGGRKSRHSVKGKQTSDCRFVRRSVTSRSLAIAEC